MTTTPKQLGQAAMSVLATAYTVPGATTAILKSFDVCNTASIPVRVRVFLVPNGGTAGTDNALLYDYQVPANGLFGWEGEQVLETGATVQIYGAVAGCTITLSGVELS